jgi:predicted LPLAT superfamily acyltransferase
VASVTGAAVVVVFAVPEERGVIHLILRGPLRVARTAGESRDVAVRRAVALFAGLLVSELRRRPFAWANFYPFWSAP